MSSGAVGNRTRGAGGLVGGFVRSAATYPSRLAVTTGTSSVSYAELHDRASRVCSALADVDEEGVGPVALLGERSISTFSGLLGSLLRGRGYVPLNPEYPRARTSEMLARSAATTLIVDSAGMRTLGALLEASATSLTVLALDCDSSSELRARWPQHRFVAAADFAAANESTFRPPPPDNPAYVLFTSGTTGRPKGVAVTHRNVRAFIDTVVARFQPNPEDRFSQTFALTFDLSVFDLFVAWEGGACVCCATDEDKLTPSRYISDSGLTVWFSVPSAATMMARMRQLKPNQFPSLRWSLFCGEALPQPIAEQWAAAAPNSILENLYGPTELTVACATYRWDQTASPQQCVNGIVPIGWPLSGMRALVVDENLTEVHEGGKGELVMTGTQLTPGYLDDPEKTAASFVPIGEGSTVFYRTGDLVRRPVGDEPMTYLGRADTQIKIRGFRVELGEVESVVRELTNCSVAVAVAWPRTTSGADGIVVFVEGTEVELASLLLRIRDRLPAYMHPREIRRISEVPRNANGKVDRAALESLLSRPADVSAPHYAPPPETSHVVDQ